MVQEFPCATPKPTTYAAQPNQLIFQQGYYTLHKHSTKWFSIYLALFLLLGNGLIWAKKWNNILNEKWWTIFMTVFAVKKLYIVCSTLNILHNCMLKNCWVKKITWPWPWVTMGTCLVLIWPKWWVIPF